MLSLALGIGHHQQIHKQERTIVSHVWNFVHNNNKPHVLSAGQHKWNFELRLPTDLPQSLESDVGSISYRLKAMIERPAFIQNTVKKRLIRIIQSIPPSYRSLEIHHQWAEKIVYDISVPSKRYAFKEIIPISFKIRPVASNLKIHAIMASLKEYSTYTANEHIKKNTRIVRLVRIEHPFHSGNDWHCVLELVVPSKPPSIFADTKTDMVCIRHRLKFVISLTNADGHISELRCAVQIIVSESLAIEPTSLPAYDEACHSAHVRHSESSLTDTRLLSTQTVENHSEPSSSSRSIAIPDTGLLTEEQESSLQSHLWWQGTDLSKVPSYCTVSNAEGLSSSLPPTYDSLTRPNPPS
ncbi:uncharacterized protein B0P05DRAFT_562940 [Gilbertella persicaria]|uniref:uncharacterized protein n=1 Tax=Gilbertella persicaria TaxID=101096 RepID=UPI00221F67A7|nr:uncharacterized protein B0P05DRAFT_562940 [Gilbertella persicaria]KAI8051097.1 hypothetical protein B0P05DRAFT_562940 [Gilbertella persicaria]